jgi:hypothetical protein
VIDYIATGAVWASNATTPLKTVTIYTDDDRGWRPKISAHINISRLALNVRGVSNTGDGGCGAKAYIDQIERSSPFDDGRIYGTFVEPPTSPRPSEDPLLLTQGRSEITFRDAFSVTFALTTEVMFAYANWSVFVYERVSPFTIRVLGA